jgi:hypothetical protein
MEDSGLKMEWLLSAQRQPQAQVCGWEVTQKNPEVEVLQLDNPSIYTSSFQLSSSTTEEHGSNTEMLQSE